MLDFTEYGWEKAVAFHGHSCPGLAIGFSMARIAARLLNLSERTRDEELICITETDACCVDAFQATLGCTFGKGNLLVKLRGKHAATFYHRPSDKGVRLYLASPPSKQLGREKATSFLLSPEAEECFAVTKAHPQLPTALITSSVACSKCGELTAEGMIRFLQNTPYCLDCLPQFSRILA